MSNFVIIENQVGPQPVSATGTVPQHYVGKVAAGVDYGSGASSVNIGGGQFVYCQGSNVASAGQFVMVSNGSAVLLASANSGSFFPIGVAAGVLSATNVYGWVQIQGKCDYAKGTNSAIAAGVPLYLAGTSGYLISTPGAGSRVIGVVAPAAYTSSQSNAFTVQLNYPQMIGVTAGL
jgi:hypothetical protein